MNDGRHGVVLEIEDKNRDGKQWIARHFPSGAIALPPFLASDLVVNSLRIRFLIKLAAVLPTKPPSTAANLHLRVLRLWISALIDAHYFSFSSVEWIIIVSASRARYVRTSESDDMKRQNAALLVIVGFNYNNQERTISFNWFYAPRI